MNLIVFNITQENTTGQNIAYDTFPSVLAKASLYSLLFVIGTFGNFMVILATIKYSSLRKPSTILICNVCLCDIVLLGIGVADFVLDQVFISKDGILVRCKILRPLSVAEVSIMVAMLLSIAIERSLAIMQPLNKSIHLNARKAWIVASVVNISAFVVAIPGFLGTEVDNGFSHCVETWSFDMSIVYHVSIFLLQYLIPLPMMTVLYARSWNCLRKRNRRTIELTTKHQRSFESPPMRRASENVYASLVNLRSGSKNHLNFEETPMKKTLSVSSMRSLKRSCSSNSFRERSNSFRERSNSFREPSNSFRERSNSWRRLSQNRLSRSLSMALRGEGEIAFSALARKRFQQSVETLRMFSCVVLMFAVCMLPHHILQLLEIQSRSIDHTLQDVLNFFIYINAAMNPFIYGGLNKEFRMAYRKMFSGKEENGLANLIRSSFLMPAAHIDVNDIIDDKQHSHRVIQRALFSQRIFRISTVSDRTDEDTLVLNSSTGSYEHNEMLSISAVVLPTLIIPTIIISRPDEEGDIVYYEDSCTEYFV